MYSTRIHIYRKGSSAMQYDVKTGLVVAYRRAMLYQAPKLARVHLLRRDWGVVAARLNHVFTMKCFWTSCTQLYRGGCPATSKYGQHLSVRDSRQCLLCPLLTQMRQRCLNRKDLISRSGRSTCP